MSDTLQLLGKLATADAGRDAIHIAVAPVVAAHILEPGERIGWIDGDREKVGRVPDTFGIVDPYLSAPVMPGQRFYAFLYPQTITSLRHVWQHPSFKDEGGKAQAGLSKEVSEQWLRDFCAEADCPGYEDVMRVIREGSAQLGDPDYYGRSYIEDEYMFFSGRDAHGEIPDEFWTHAEIVLGRPITNKPKFFSCSC